MAIKGFEWLKERHVQEQKIEKVRQLQPIAEKLDCSLAALSIAWCIKNPNVSTAILGATKKEQLHQNLKALDVLPKLTEDIMQEIDSIAGTKPKLPEY
jgi:aryl-alcohol dehydrogenase-like predicted oxidoreductase